MTARHRSKFIAGFIGRHITLSLALLSGVSGFAAQSPLGDVYTATAYSDKGQTASGQLTHRHVVAADPDLLPLGTRIRIKKAGRYSGEYVVADTGDKIQGNRLDIYMPSQAAARKFGVKKVRVKVIEMGNGTQAKTKESDLAVKKDVAKEVEKNAVGSAATEDDIAAKNAAAKPAAAKPKASPATATEVSTRPQ